MKRKAHRHYDKQDEKQVSEPKKPRQSNWARRVWNGQVTDVDRHWAGLHPGQLHFAFFDALSQKQVMEDLYVGR